jgi:uncharacterized protein (TIGR02246 family)
MAVGLLAGCATVPAHNEAADRAAIHELLTAYGSTLDARDFDGFAALFAKDGSYNGATFPAAATNMRTIFAENRLGFKEPNYHVFFNEVVTFDDADHAQSTSMSFYVVPGENGAPTPALMARYRDRLVREDGRWKFTRRDIESLLPAASRR